MIHSAPPHTSRLLIRLAITLLALVIASDAAAVTDAVVSQYYEVPSLYDPALTGTSDYVRIHAGARMQWVGVDNAPRAYALAAEAPFRLRSCPMGGGIYLLKQTHGPYSSLQAALQLSAKLKKHGGEFSFGLQAGLHSQKFKGSDTDMPDVPRVDISGQALDLGIGMAYARSRWYVAMSCMHLTSPSISSDTSPATDGLDDTAYRIEARRTLYFQAGCNIAVKNTLFEVIPSVIAATDFTSNAGIASLRLRYRRTFTAGVGYRYNDGVCAMLGVEFKNFYIGYTFEHNVSDIGRTSSGSHEAWIGYAFKLDLSAKTKHRHRSVRFM